MTLYRIRMEAARGPGHPDGDPRHGYEFIAPLNGDGALDVEGWRKARSVCTVRRFSPEGEEHGRLAHGRWGWRFHYEGELEDPIDDEEEPIFRLESKRLAVGEYITVREEGGETETFRIVAMQKSPLG